MSSEENEKSEAPKKSKLSLILLLVGGLAAGIAGGVFFAAPMLGGKAAHGAGAAKDAGHDAEDGGADAEAAEPGAPKPVYQIDNLVLNPAGTEGTRFLMATVAVAVPDEAAMALLKERDLELRDAILRVLGSKTVQELADVSRRDSLKTEIFDVLAGQLPKKTVREVYLPQFVIQ